jgi:hypothetical protein
VIRVRTNLAAGTGFLVLASLVMAGCVTAPTETESERLDPDTGTTLTLMPRPLELIVEKARGANTDPFAYVAPFETNRMGSHELFLWVSAPQAAGTLSVPQLYCGDNVVPLDKFDGTLKDIGLSSPPYKTPAPWSAQWYFKLSGEVLDCLASAPRIRVTTQAADAPEPDSYVAKGQATSAVNTFLIKLRT